MRGKWNTGVNNRPRLFAAASRVLGAAIFESEFISAIFCAK